MSVNEQNGGRCSHVAFLLHMYVMYPENTVQVTNAARLLARQYRNCYDVYTMMKEDIANESMKKLRETASLKEMYRYAKSIEKELNQQIIDLMKIDEID